MSEIERMKDELHEQCVENELYRLQVRRETDPQFTIHHLKVLLDHEVLHQDLNWSDRGGIQHIEGQARVVALEITYHNWQKELRQAGG